jgi:hypothetical protein
MPDLYIGGKFGVVQSPGTSWSLDEWGILSLSPDWFKSCSSFTIEDDVHVARQSQAFRKVREGMQSTTTENPGAKNVDMQEPKRIIQASTMFQTVKYARRKTSLGQGVAL